MKSLWASSPTPDRGEVRHRALHLNGDAPRQVSRASAGHPPKTAPQNATASSGSSHRSNYPAASDEPPRLCSSSRRTTTSPRLRRPQKTSPVEAKIVPGSITKAMVQTLPNSSATAGPIPVPARSTTPEPSRRRTPAADIRPALSSSAAQNVVSDDSNDELHQRRHRSQKLLSDDGAHRENGSSRGDNDNFHRRSSSSLSSRSGSRPRPRRPSVAERLTTGGSLYRCWICEVLCKHGAGSTWSQSPPLFFGIPSAFYAESEAQAVQQPRQLQPRQQQRSCPWYLSHSPASTLTLCATCAAAASLDVSASSQQVLQCVNHTPATRHRTASFINAIREYKLLLELLAEKVLRACDRMLRLSQHQSKCKTSGTPPHEELSRGQPESDAAAVLHGMPLAYTSRLLRRKLLSQLLQGLDELLGRDDQAVARAANATTAGDTSAIRQQKTAMEREVARSQIMFPQERHVLLEEMTHLERQLIACDFYPEGDSLCRCPSSLDGADPETAPAPPVPPPSGTSRHPASGRGGAVSKRNGGFDAGHRRAPQQSKSSSPPNLTIPQQHRQKPSQASRSKASPYRNGGAHPHEVSMSQLRDLIYSSRSNAAPHICSPPEKSSAAFLVDSSPPLAQASDPAENHRIERSLWSLQQEKEDLNMGEFGLAKDNRDGGHPEATAEPAPRTAAVRSVEMDSNNILLSYFAGRLESVPEFFFAAAELSHGSHALTHTATTPSAMSSQSAWSSPPHPPHGGAANGSSSTGNHDGLLPRSPSPAASFSPGRAMVPVGLTGESAELATVMQQLQEERMLRMEAEAALLAAHGKIATLESISNDLAEQLLSHRLSVTFRKHLSGMELLVGRWMRLAQNFCLQKSIIFAEEMSSLVRQVQRQSFKALSQAGNRNDGKIRRATPNEGNRVPPVPSASPPLYQQQIASQQLQPSTAATSAASAAGLLDHYYSLSAAAAAAASKQRNKQKEETEAEVWISKDAPPAEVSSPPHAVVAGSLDLEDSPPPPSDKMYFKFPNQLQLKPLASRTEVI